MSGLLPALAISCVLHVLLLWPEAWPRTAQPQGRPLTATLTATLRAAAVADRAAAMTRIDAPAQKRRDDSAIPRPVVVAGAAAVAPPAAQARLPDDATAGAAEAEPAVLKAATGEAGPQGRSQSAQAVVSAPPDADGIRAYRIGLAREARAHRQYPSLARERGWAGTAEVRVDVSRDGRPRQVLLARSSGHDILDREAVAMLSRAAAAAALPESLRGRAFAVLLPVVFDIADAQ